jgi:hypothetical protein
MMNCHGKCLLMKKLNREENKDRHNPNRKVDNNEEVIFSATFFASVAVYEPTLRVSHIGSIESLLLAGFNKGIFHPPSGL